MIADRRKSKSKEALMDRQASKRHELLIEPEEKSIVKDVGASEDCGAYYLHEVNHGVMDPRAPENSGEMTNSNAEVPDFVVLNFTLVADQAFPSGFLEHVMDASMGGMPS